MGPLPIAHWHDALDKMETALTGAARALDRREERFEYAAAPSAGEGELPPALAQLDARLQGWADRLRAADELTATREKELSEQAAAVARWHSRFAAWAELLK